MERELLSRFSNLVFIGLTCAKMLMNTSKSVRNVKEQVDSPEGMKCHCMVQVGQMGSTGRIKTCRLHDLMRDLCLSKARKENFLYIINGSQQNSTIDVASSSNLSDARRIDEVRRLAVFLDQRVDQLIPQDKQVNEHLRSLVFFHDKKCRMENWDLVKGVFVEFKLLRFLDLEGIKGLKGQSLPKEVGNLLWLKFGKRWRCGGCC